MPRKLSSLYRLCEARFPDEKFWDKNGDPIHPQPKGPGRAVGHSRDEYELDGPEPQVGLAPSKQPPPRSPDDWARTSTSPDPDPTAPKQSMGGNPTAREVADDARSMGFDVQDHGWIKITNPDTGEVIYIAKGKLGTPRIDTTLPPDDSIGTAAPTRPNGQIKSTKNKPSRKDIAKLLGKL